MNSYTITEKCVGCTLCARNCPVKAISGNLKELHSIDPDKCIRCGLCGKQCGVGAILDENGNETVKVPKTEWKHPVINDVTCVGCHVCVENCPKHCLDLSEPKFHGDIHIIAELKSADDCIGCGLCSKSCPILAITME